MDPFTVDPATLDLTEFDTDYKAILANVHEHLPPQELTVTAADPRPSEPEIDYTELLAEMHQKQVIKSSIVMNITAADLPTYKSSQEEENAKLRVAIAACKV